MAEKRKANYEWLYLSFSRDETNQYTASTTSEYKTFSLKKKFNGIQVPTTSRNVGFIKQSGKR